MYELSGTLAGTGLPAVLRFLAELRKTGCLHLGTPDGAGQVYLDAGRVTGAVLADHDGLSALEQIMACADAAAFSFEATPVAPVAPTIDLDLEPLLRHLETVAVNGTAAPIAALAAANGAPHGPGHCPALGFEDDQAHSFNRPTRLHRCFATDKPAPLTLEQQRDLCLTDGYPNCPRLQPRESAGGAQRQLAQRKSVSGSDAGIHPERLSPGIFVGAVPGARTNGRVGTASTNGHVHGSGANGLTGAHADDETPARMPVTRAARSEPTNAPVELGVPETSADGRRPRRAPPPRVQLALALALVLLVLGIAGVAALLTARQAPASVASVPTPAPVLAAAAAPRPAIDGSASARGVGPTAAAAPTVTQPTTPAATPRVILDERFADPSSLRWPNTTDGPAQLASSEYVVRTRMAGQFVAIGVPMPQVFEDVTVSATFRKVNGPAGGGFGLILRNQADTPNDGVDQNGHYYVLEVGDRGEVGIWRREDERWIDLVPWQPASAVNTGTGVNEIIARAAGAHLTLSVNGVQVATRDDPTYRAGTVGLFVGGDGNVVSIDRFTIQQP